MLISTTGNDARGREHTISMACTRRRKDILGNMEYTVTLIDDTGYKYSPIFLFAPNDAMAGVLLERDLRALHITLHTR